MKTNITVSVNHDEGISSEDVTKAINLMLWMGQDRISQLLWKGESIYEEHMSAYDDIAPNADLENAKIARSIDTEACSVAETPRVIVTVNGGLADWISSGGVDIVLFDWDNYESLPEKGADEDIKNSYAETRESCKVPSRFADLAVPNNIPVLTTESEFEEE